ncbi:MAG TPA: lipoprotein insertase outer membrane protein LolB [Burkholderiales bacterium]|nr:lipoprotein insertase outer membrane protein LolB [Burkholderiales bacterium]
MSPRLAFLAPALLLLAALAGCATKPSIQDLPASNANIDAFSLNGRAAVNADGRGYSATVRWRHAGGRDSLRLLSPVGSVVAQIDADKDGATLTTGDKKVYKSTDAESLMRDVLGWNLPLAGLRYWVVGRSNPDAPVQSEARDDRHRLSSLVQSDWHIGYLDYFGESAMPARMSLAREKLSLRLVVERWEFPE